MNRSEIRAIICATKKHYKISNYIIRNYAENVSTTTLLRVITNDVITNSVMAPGLTLIAFVIP